MRLPSLLILLALLVSPSALAGTGAALPAAAPRAFGDEVSLTNRFFDAGYTYCDARVLSTHWGKELWETKVQAGTILAQSRPARLAGDLQAAQALVRGRRLPPCNFYDTGLESDQAVALANAWGVPVSEAKAKAAWLSSTGEHQGLLSQVQALGATAAPQEPDPISTFLQSDRYDYCHALMVAAMWKQDVREAKSTIGYKLANGWDDTVASLVGAAREQARANPANRCSFGDTRYLYEDAQALGRLWGVDTAQAKARIEQKYLDGTEALLAEELRRAGRG